MSPAKTIDESPYTLPATGFVRQKQLAAIIPFSRTTLWRKVRDGAFPAPVKLSAGISAWRVEEVRAWLTAVSPEAPTQIEFERESLFEAVWTTSISTLAKNHRISEGDLRKVCVALAIPVPGRDYRARVAAGGPATIPKLPPTSGATRFVSRMAAEPAPGAPIPHADRWLERLLAFEADPANVIIVEAELTKPHPLVAEALRQVESARATLERMQIDRLSPRSGPPMLKSERYGPNWWALERSGFVDFPEIALPLRVSIGAADRALRIWDALLKACAKRGMSPTISSRRVRIDVGGVPIQLRLSERMDRAPPRRGVMGSVPKIPSGMLRIYIGAGSVEKKISDEPGRALEEQLNEVMCEAYNRAADERKYSARWAPAPTKPASAEGTAERRDQGNQRLNRRAQEDLEAQLGDEASRWARACAIRKYVANVIAQTPKPCPAALRDWISWASSVADKVDPTPARTCGLVIPETE